MTKQKEKKNIGNLMDNFIYNAVCNTENVSLLNRFGTTSFWRRTYNSRTAKRHVNMYLFLIAIYSQLFTERATTTKKYCERTCQDKSENILKFLVSGRFFLFSSYYFGNNGLMSTADRESSVFKVIYCLLREHYSRGLLRRLWC